MARYDNSLRQNKARYTQGGITDNLGTRIGWWERQKFPKESSDIYLKVSKRGEGRPDIIAYQVYGDQYYAWLVMQYNSIVDPVTEIVKGTLLRLPTPTRVRTSIVTRTLR